MRIKVHGGTRSDQQELCRTCDHAHIFKGPGHSQEIIRCAAEWNNPIKITFPVVECNKYLDKSQTNLGDLTKIAWSISADRRTGHVGFTNKLTKEDRSKMLDEAHDGNPLE